jgi:hypothetical protein
MKVINLLTLSVPDEGYQSFVIERPAQCQKFDNNLHQVRSMSTD